MGVWWYIFSCGLRREMGSLGDVDVLLIDAVAVWAEQSFLPDTGTEHERGTDRRA